LNHMRALVGAIWVFVREFQSTLTFRCGPLLDSIVSLRLKSIPIYIIIKAELFLSTVIFVSNFTPAPYKKLPAMPPVSQKNGSCELAFLRPGHELRSGVAYASSGSSAGTEMGAGARRQQEK